MIFPERLLAGECIGVVSPSSPVSMERQIQCKAALESMGFEVCMGDSTMQSLNGYLAGSDDIRAGDINQMFANPKIKAIFCLRGGDGSSRIMDKLDYNLIKNNPKIFMGFSDITNLHLAFQKYSDLVTFHGPMVSSNFVDNLDSFTLDGMWSALSMNESLKLLNPPGEAFGVMSDGCGEGILIGGNLSLICESMGTFWEIDTTHKVLFIEDIGERVPRLNKYIDQLRYSGKLSKVRGILLGDFSNCSNPYDESYTYLEYFKEAFQDLGIPIFYNIKSGHCNPMSTLPFGTICRINTKEYSITFHK